MQCVILAGGLGTRIASVAPALPKALIPVGGEPFAHHQLSLLATNGIREVVYCIGHHGDAIRAYVGSGSRWSLRVSYVDEGRNLRGTAGALRLASEAGMLRPAFFVLYGDSYLPIDYRAVWGAFEQATGMAGLMTVFRNDQKWDASNVLFDGQRVLLYDKGRKDPRAAKMVYIDYGLTALRREVVEREVPPGGIADLAEMYHRLSVTGLLAGYEVRERFYEIGSPAGLQELRKRLGNDPVSG
jgi:NDP-sugar pyrophosphorylase family protein